MKLPIETQIKLKKFVPRSYQWPIIDAIEKEGFKRVLAIMPRRCLSGDSHITMSDGSWKFLRDLSPGDRVLSWNGTTFEEDVVQKKWSTGTQDTKIVRAGSYLPLTSSDNHVFATATTGYDKVTWQELKDINKHRTLLQYAGHQQEPKGLSNKELAEFWGYMVADGYVVGYQQPKFTNTNMAILKRVEHLSQSLFGITPIWRPKGNAYDLGLTNGTRGGGATKNPVKELFRNHGLDVQKSKQRLPGVVWKWSKKEIYAFLAGVLSADGSISTHSGFTAATTHHDMPPSVEIVINCGQSYDYAWDIYWLLRKVGIVSQSPFKEKESNWKIRIGKSAHIKKLLRRRVYGKEKAQDNALETINTHTKETSTVKGCFRSRFKTAPGEPEELFDIETRKNHNFIANGYLVHNSGKDLTAFNVCIRQCLARVCVVYYIFPTFAQAKRVIWDSITIDGKMVMDYIPPELITSKNSQEMKIRFVNGSLLQLVGSNDFDNLMGTNPYGAVFSEYSLQDPRAWQYISPILAASDGWALFLSTPRGKSNHLYPLYELAQEADNWKCIKLTLDDTHHISEGAMAIERREKSEEIILQEYYTSFDTGQDGSYYGNYIDKMELNGQIGAVPWEPAFPVYTSWDLGVRDSTVILFFQVTKTGTVRIIDTYCNNSKGMEHYVSVIDEKPYKYAKHFAPHDIAVRDFSTGMTRLDKARDLGLIFEVKNDRGQLKSAVPNVSIMDGIEAVRSTLPRIWIDSDRCRELVYALSDYHKEWDPKLRLYKNHPKHDHSSHWADAFRYLCLSLPQCQKGTTAKELDERYRRAMAGPQGSLPPFFRDGGMRY